METSNSSFPNYCGELSSLPSAKHRDRPLTRTVTALLLLLPLAGAVTTSAEEEPRPETGDSAIDTSEAARLSSSLMGKIVEDRPLVQDIVRRAATGDSEAQANVAMLLRLDTTGKAFAADKLSAEENLDLFKGILVDLLNRKAFSDDFLRLLATFDSDAYEKEVQPLFPGQAPPRPYATVREFFDFVFHRGLYWIWPADVWIVLGFSREDILEAYEKAASTGDEIVAQELADVHEGGTFVKPNAAAELKWRRVCSDAYSAYRLGCLYATAPDRCLPAPNGAVAARHFTRAEAVEGSYAISARNALLCRALHVQPSLVPIPLDDLAQRQASALEEEPDAFFAPMLLAAKAFLDGDENKAREWVSLSAEQGYDVAVAVLRDWEAIVSTDKEKSTPFVEAMRRFLGVADTPDWDVALSVALPAAERGDADAYALAWRLLNCEWWEGFSLERRHELATTAARAGLPRAVRDVAIDEFHKALSWENPKAALATLGPEVDSDIRDVLQHAIELLDRMKTRVNEMMSLPPTGENLRKLGDEMEEVGSEFDALSADMQKIREQDIHPVSAETADDERTE